MSSLNRKAFRVDGNVPALTGLGSIPLTRSRHCPAGLSYPAGSRLEC